MEDCIFCKIVSKERKSFIIWEDKKHIAFLDRYPNTYGQVNVIPKKHFPSDILELEKEDYEDLMISAKEVSKLIKEKLCINRIAIVCEGLGINHAHIKLYPMHGVKKEFEEILSLQTIYFDKYPGYISTIMGPEKSDIELEEIKSMFCS